MSQVWCLFVQGILRGHEVEVEGGHTEVFRVNVLAVKLVEVIDQADNFII